MKILKQAAACSPCAEEYTYIYSIIPVLDASLAAITSADELLVLDRRTLQTTSSPRVSDVLTGVTRLVLGDSDRNVVCAARDGSVATFDLRSGRYISKFKMGGLSQLSRNTAPVWPLKASNGSDISQTEQLPHWSAVAEKSRLVQNWPTSKQSSGYGKGVSHTQARCGRPIWSLQFPVIFAFN